MRHSLREILAAWACCCLLGFGALAAIGHRDPGIAPGVARAPRVHIPDRLGSARPDRSIEDEFADEASDAGDAADTASNGAAPSLYSQQHVADSGRCRLRSFAERFL